MTKTKRQRGQFYTIKNPFTHPAFRRWAGWANLPNSTILEPFAGCNSLINHLKKMDLCRAYAAFDIEPNADDVIRCDTLRRFPRDFDVCVTNPPWLAKNSATNRGLAFPNTRYDDLYKYSVDKCLENCGYLAALVPESFIRSNLFRDRLYAFISLTKQIFVDTAHPVGLALFLPKATPHIAVYSGRKWVGELAEIESQRPLADASRRIIFNKPNGNLGLIAVDDTHGASIRFCHTWEIENYEIVSTCRYITRLEVRDKQIDIDRLNDALNKFRVATCDVLMTSYRGLRKDGKYRRRLDWSLARGIVCAG